MCFFYSKVGVCTRGGRYTTAETRGVGLRWKRRGNEVVDGSKQRDHEPSGEAP